MKLSEDFIKELLTENVTDAKYRQHNVFCKIFDADFAYDARYLYYGFFNVAKGGSLKLKLRTSAELEFTPILQDAIITQPMLFDNLTTAAKVYFTGVRIEVTSGITVS